MESILSTYGTQQEIYSIDECFLNLPDTGIDFCEYA
jgi:nucleotidyltransferase/DNA polymerase involved in DNA repair